MMTQMMTAVNIRMNLQCLHEDIDETDAPQDLQIAPQNLPMAQAEEGPTGVEEAPFNPRRSTRPHTRPQRLGQNIYDI